MRDPHSTAKLLRRESAVGTRAGAPRGETGPAGRQDGDLRQATNKEAEQSRRDSGLTGIRVHERQGAVERKESINISSTQCEPTI